jgi:inner membrane protein
MLIAVALVSHLVLDSWNSYGVHPFWPFDARWIYGDSIFIVEPWLWLLLGASAAMNTREAWGGLALAVVLVGPVVAATVSHVIPIVALVALVIAAVGLCMAMLRWPSRRRAGAALALSALFVSSMFTVRQRVRGEVLVSTDATARGQTVDVVLSPEAANPLCWSALTIVPDEPRDEYVTTRASVTPFGVSGCGDERAASVVFEAAQRHSLAQLRELHRRDCWVRAWMRFGRVPVIGDGSIRDIRYGERRGNFSEMQLKSAAEGEACPRFLPEWGTPRADLIGLGPSQPE